ncbi:MAG: helix-turn-helix transcriptional regulator [Eubacteriales bacterium]
MYKNKTESGRNNICGTQIKSLRLQRKDKPSQRRFAELLQIAGLDVDKNAVSRMESGERFITDIELKIIAQVLNVSYEDLLDK